MLYAEACPRARRTAQVTAIARHAACQNAAEWHSECTDLAGRLLSLSGHNWVFGGSYQNYRIHLLPVHEGIGMPEEDCAVFLRSHTLRLVCVRGSNGADPLNQSDACPDPSE
jgi:hypothetical protein